MLQIILVQRSRQINTVPRNGANDSARFPFDFNVIGSAQSRGLVNEFVSLILVIGGKNHMKMRAFVSSSAVAAA